VRVWSIAYVMMTLALGAKKDQALEVVKFVKFECMSARKVSRYVAGTLEGQQDVLLSRSERIESQGGF